MKRIAFTMICAFLSIAVIHAQATNHKIQALFIYNFAKNIKWPEEAQNFKIAVIGDKAFYDELTTSLQGKKTNGKDFNIQQFEHVGDAADFNIVFLAANRSKDLPEALVAAGTKNSLIITENDMIDNGAGISFVQVDEKLRFKMSSSNINKKGLQVSSGLQALAMR